MARPARFSFTVVGLAYAGVVVGYVPFLTLLLPARLSALVPGADKIDWLSALTLAGAACAGGGAVLAGALSDRTASGRFGRRGWIALGLVGTLIAFWGVEASLSPWTLLGWTAAFQLALNFMLGPMMAAFAEETPPEKLGRLGGVLGGVYPLGALSAILVTAPSIVERGLDLALVAVLTAGLVLPFLLRRPAPPSVGEAASEPPVANAWLGFGLAGLSRLLLQVAGAALFAFFLYYFETVEDRGQAGGQALSSRLAWLAAVVTVASAPVALLLGRLIDARGGWRTWLAASAMVCAAGLALMALAPGWNAAVIGYAAFACFLAVFLSLHAGYAIRLLPDPRRRGFDLGLMNLTNTLPAFVAPLLAWTLVRDDGFAPLLLTLSVLSVLSALTMLISRPRAGHSA